MKRFFQHQLFTFVFVLTFCCGAKADLYEDFSKRHDLSEYKEEQKDVLKEEINAYGSEIDYLYDTDREEYKRKINEFFIKLRDGFKVYKLARHPLIEERINAFNNLGTGIEVRVYAYVEGAFLNNVFQRLAEAYYSTTHTDNLVKLKYKFKEAPDYQEGNPLFLPVPDFDISEGLRKEIGDRLTELNQTAEASFSETAYALFPGNTSSDALVIKQDFPKSVTEVLIKLTGVSVANASLALPLIDLTSEPIENEEMHTYITPAGTPIQIPAKAVISDVHYGEELFPVGALLCFEVGGILYEAKIKILEISKNEEKYFPFYGYYQVHNGSWGTKCYEQTSVPSGNVQVRWLERYYDPGKYYEGYSTKKCGILIKEGYYDFKQEASIALACGTEYKSLREMDLFKAFRETRQIGKAYFVDGCEEREEASDPIQSIVEFRKLRDWIKEQGGNATVWLADCDEENREVAFIDEDHSTYTSMTAAEAKKKVADGNFSTDIGVFACYDEKEGKWEVKTNYRKGSLKINPKLKGITEQRISEISDEYVQKVVNEKSGKGLPGLVSQRGSPDYTADGDQFKYDELGLFEAVIAVKDFAKNISEEARVPQKMWDNQTDPLAYERSPVHVPSMLCGAGDKGLEKVTDVAEIFHFGLDLATNPDLAKETWKSLSGLKAEDVKEMVVQMAKDELGTDNYSKGGCFARYQGGKHVVVVGTMIMGVAANFGKIKQVIDGAGDLTKKKVDDIDRNGSNNNDGNSVDVDDPWNLKKQKLGLAPNSKVLGENLEATGKIRSPNSAAHHVVPGGHSNEFADQTRLILKREGIDINEASNGVFLPKSSKYVIDDAIAHSKIHTKVYFEELFNRLNNVPAGKMRNELQKISQELLNGTFPY